MSGLTNKQLSEIKHVFTLYEHAPGRLAISNFAKTARALCIPVTNAEVAQIEADLKQVGSSDLDLPEFVNIIANKYKVLNVDEELKEGFDLFDRDGNGKISVKELRFVLTNLGERVNQRDIDMLLAEYDLLDKDFINFEQFKKLLLS